MLVDALDAQLARAGRGRMTVEDFARLRSEVLLAAWRASMPENQVDPTMQVIVAGMDEGARYGDLWSCTIPTQPEPERMASDAWDFAMGYWLRRAASRP